MTSWNSVEKRSNSLPSTVLLGVGAGIAAYKVVHVVRELRRHGIEVYVAPTEDSLHFVGATTWSELSENPVVDSLFDNSAMGHVELARLANLIVIAPCTADLAARITAGFADSTLLATILASKAPKILVPAMHTQMWLNPATQENFSVLQKRGFTVIPPESGHLSSGDTGLGRLPDPDVIVDAIVSHSKNGELHGKHVIVTAGGTHEPLDPVRFLGNRSSGRMGVELAVSAAARGAEVTLIAAHCTVPLPIGDSRIHVVHVNSAMEMHSAVDRFLASADALVMSAAVADYRPAEVSSVKLKKTTMGDEPTLTLVKNPDILASVCASPLKPRIVIGFAAETGENFLESGAQKVHSKGADYIAVNRVGESIGFGEVDSTLVVFNSAGDTVAQLSGQKKILAEGLVDLLVAASA